MKKYDPSQYERIKVEFQHVLEEVRSATGSEQQWRALIKFQLFLLQNCDYLSDEGKKLSDETSKELLEKIKIAITAMPDNPQSRQLRRAIETVHGSRIKVKSQIRSLEVRPRKPSRFYTATRTLFQRQIQQILDFWQDIFGNTLHGEVQFVLFYLIGFCAEELLTAFHFASRSRAGQAFTHLRAVHESLDLIDLFLQKPALVHDWINGKKWKKFKPGRVRSQIQRDEVFSNMYKMFSEVGSHPSWEGLRARVKRALKDPSPRPQFVFRMGNMSGTPEAIMSQVHLILASAQVLSAVIKAFPEFLNEDETRTVLQRASDDVYRYINWYILKPLKGVEPGIEEFRKNLRRMRGDIARALKPPSK